jgi:hypothetical protein
VHAFGEVQETAFKNDPGLPEVGVGWMLQLVPSQRSVSVPTELPELSKAGPTAIQTEGDVQETPPKTLKGAPGGVGAGVIRHAMPSHRSATGPLALLKRSVAWPTAMQAEGDLHDTPRRLAPRVPRGLTVGWMLHCVPSHPSPRVTSAPEESDPMPTATHVDVPGQATPPSWLKPPGRFGVLCRLQSWPSQRSAIVEKVFEPSTLQPTAVQADEDEHATLKRTASCDPVGFGVDCTRHFVPFHCSASVMPVLGAVDPTAMQAEDEVHDTEKRAAPGFELAGVDSMLQVVPSQRSTREP